MKKTIFLVALVVAIISSAFTVFAYQTIYGEEFPDIANDAYYRDAVENMRSIGVISGYENGNFGPNDSVTRGQMATILDRYDHSLTDRTVGGGRGVDDLIRIVCYSTTAEDMSNSHLGSEDLESNQALLDKICNLY